jgi:hypothetical protein
MSCTKECADLVTMFVELLQGEWQCKYDLLKELYEKDVCRLERENKELRQKIINDHCNSVTEKNLQKVSYEHACPPDESEDSDEEVEDPEPEIIEDVPTLMTIKEDQEDQEDQEEVEDPEPEIIEDVPSLSKPRFTPTGALY